MLKRTLAYAPERVVGKYWIIVGLILSVTGFEAFGQDKDPIFEAAQKRYPSLKPCDLPEIHTKGLCDTIEVYEDQLNKTGKKIPIEVIVLPALTDHPLQSVYTHHTGGNGMAARNKLFRFDTSRLFGRQLRTLQDVLIMDERGTGLSSIRCEAMDSLQPNSYPLAYDERLIRDCLNQVIDQFDLSLYTTPHVVQDYETVRDVLKISQFDSYGISYGVRVSLEYMRQYPERIRTITFQASSPPGFNYINEMDVAIQEQLDILFVRCQRDSTCNKYYPNFRRELYEVRDKLKRNPEKISYELEQGGTKEVYMDDLLFRRMIGHTILHGDVNEVLPLIVHQCYRGNYSLLIQSVGELDLDMPVFLSKFCPEEVKRFKFDPEAFGANQLFTEGAIGQEKVSACQWWLDLPPADWLEEPLQSKSPVLLFTGQYDANTPIRMGEQIRNSFPQTSRHLVLSHEGHYGGANSCRDQILIEFIMTGQLKMLDITCLDSLKPRSFEFEIPIGKNEIEKFIGEYTTSDTTRQLHIFMNNGLLSLEDEFSRFSGNSNLLYKGNNTFNLLDCNHCQLKFSVDQGEIIRVDRIYRDTVTFTPVDQ